MHQRMIQLSYESILLKIYHVEKTVLTNSGNLPKRKIPSDIFIVATLERAYNDFVVEKIAEFFGPERLLAALLKHKERVSDKLIARVAGILRHLRLAA